MFKKFKNILVTALLFTLPFCAQLNAAGKYGFAEGSGFGGSSCGLAQSFMPISFKYDRGRGGSQTHLYFNIFYVPDNIDGMSNYADFYTSNYDEDPNDDKYGQMYWPEAPAILTKGKDTALCTMENLGGSDREYDDHTYDGGYSEKCVYGLTHANRGQYINKGVSDYDRIIGMYPDVKIVADVAPDNANRYKTLLDVRKLKFFRVEVFTPYTGSAAMHRYNDEPLYFEYTKGNDNWLVRSAYGSTAKDDQNYANDAAKISDADLQKMLPEKINLNLLTDIQIDLDTSLGVNPADLKPIVRFVDITPEQKARVPQSCL